MFVIFLGAFYIFLGNGVRWLEEKQRVIQEYVPGKQVTLAHLIAHPNKSIYKKLGLSDENCEAIGILTITPSEAAIIAADVATKGAGVEVGFLDRFSGSLVITGDVSSVEAALKEVCDTLENILSFTTTKITKS
ncbi:ethanolamine utilization microcompartment protein EutS [Clostridium senegalense]|uniref:ethanolamine utilization microcompartment protein EutS n=1 Tax=Clostridium senegalense TaxID=1465809 RepID=UPI000288C782|nr:BMC domain-containing protein [Clostridium senegalense]MBU5226082.1 BMC domain-containing protein [Clostridium senegalense]